MKITSTDKPFFNSEPKVNEQESISQSKPIQDITAQSKSQSIIGGNIKFRGELIGTEDIHIEGTIEGTIIMEGHNLSIGTNGTIDANVHASNITINGSLNGDVLADELISIRKSARVKGNLIAPRIQLEDGGKFRGSMDMVDNEQEKKDSLMKFKEKLIHPDLPQKDNNTNKKPAQNNPHSNPAQNNSHSKPEKKYNQQSGSGAKETVKSTS
jgi:cytoskeletal protein CcmA (bactofilin family)